MKNVNKRVINTHPFISFFSHCDKILTEQFKKLIINSWFHCPLSIVLGLLILSPSVEGI